MLEYSHRCLKSLAIAAEELKNCQFSGEGGRERFSSALFLCLSNGVRVLVSEPIRLLTPAELADFIVTGCTNIIII